MSSQLHYIRHRGQVTGPFELTELKKMAQRGAVSRVHQISPDGKTWTAAGKYSELFAGPLFLGSGQLPQEPPLDVIAAKSRQPIHPAVKQMAQETTARRMIEPESPPPAPPARHPSNVLIWVFGLLFFVLAGTGLAVIAYVKTHANDSPSTPPNASAGTSTPAVTNKPPASSPAVSDDPSEIVSPPLPSTPASDARNVVRSIEDEAKIGQSVGLVVCGATLTRRGQTSQMPASEGSCFAVTADGFLLTNRHVIKEVDTWLTDPNLHNNLLQRHGVDFRPKIWVFFGGTKFEAQVIHASLTNDLAILKVSREQPYFRLSTTGRAPRNEDVCAIGFPGIAMQPLSDAEMNQQLEDGSHLATDITEFFKPRDFEFTLTRGVLGRTFNEAGGITWIQHEATLRHGNSGGPLVNKNGIVLGINTRLQTSREDVQTNLSLEISQLREEIQRYAPGTAWE